MEILNNQQAKLAWANNQPLLINNTARNGWEVFNHYDWMLDVFEKYDFQLKPAVILIGGQQVEIPQPVQNLSDLAPDQTVFVPNLMDLDMPMSYQNTKGNEFRLNRYIQQNLLHKIESMAVAHAYALVKLNGGENEESIAPIEKNDEPQLEQKEIKTPRNRRTKKEIEADKQAADLKKLADTILTSLADCKNSIEVSTVCFQLGKYGFSTETLEQIEKAKNEKLDSFKAVIADSEVNQFELERTVEGESNIISIKSAVQSQTKLEPEVNDEYKTKLAGLIQEVQKAQTIPTAKAPARYTSSWTDEQRKPLNDQINKRVSELEAQGGVKTENPSMVVKILNAADLTELDALEIDVAGLDPFIQTEMKKYIDQRRDELATAVQGKG